MSNLGVPSSNAARAYRNRTEVTSTFTDGSWPRAFGGRCQLLGLPARRERELPDRSLSRIGEPGQIQKDNNERQR